MGREGGAQETELAPATGTGPWLTKVRKTIDGTSCAYPAEAALALAINPKNDSGQPYRYTVEETSSSVAGASASYTKR